MGFPTKNVIILVVTVTVRGPHPKCNPFYKDKLSKKNLILFKTLMFFMCFFVHFINVKFLL